MNSNINNQFIEPYKSKTNFIQVELSNCQKKNHFVEKIIIQQPKTGFPSRKNIGIFSQTTDLASPWVPIPTVKYILKTYELFPKEIVLQDYEFKSDVNSCIIDFEKYSQYLRVKLMNSEP